MANWPTIQVMATGGYWRPYSLRSKYVRYLIPDLDFVLHVDSELKLVASLKKHLGLFVGNALQREADIARTLARHVAEDAAIYDVGANIGLYTLMFACNRRRRVVSIEPTSIALQYLRRNVHINKLANVDVHALALSDRAGVRHVAVDRVTTATSHVCEPGEPGVEHPCSDLDSLIEENCLPAPALIKLDVEGHEESILRGMTRTLGRYRPRIYLEGGLRNEDGEVRAMRQLAALGYRLHDLSGKRALEPGTGEYAFLAVPL